MRKSEAAKYARWSVAAALVFAGLTVGVYLKRGWTRIIERRNAPPASPVNVERQSSLLTFSKVEENRTIFTVEASKSTDFRGLNATDLEGVKITIFGKDGGRHDTMETHACRYAKDSGDITCSGDVQITLRSDEQWKASGSKPVAQGAMKVETSGMAFNRASGTAKTEEAVRFTFANGDGQARGAEYRSDEGTLHLQRDVRLRLYPPPDAKKDGREAASPKEPINVAGTRMDFSRDAGTILLSGSAEAKTQTERLTAAALLLELDRDFRAKKLIATSDVKDARPEFTAQKGAGKQRILADQMTATLAAQGWIMHAEATGHVSGEAERGEETQSVKAQTASVEMAPGQNMPKLLVLKGNVDARTNSCETATNGGSGDGRRLTTEELRLVFAEKDVAKGTRLAAADTPGPGRIEWIEAGNASTKASQTVLQANQLGMQFDGAGKASRLEAKGNVRTERNFAGAEKQTATATNGFVELQPQGGWSRMELNEDVRLNEGQRAAQADHAVFARAEQTVILTGHATARDATSLTSAKKLTFWQATGEMRGEGGVRSSDLSGRGGSLHLAQVPANVSADQLRGNIKTGRALYIGHARLWQGDSVLEADSIELLKNERMMNAVGNVKAVFPQAPANSSAAAGVGPRSKQPVLWHAQSAKMTYWDQENRARLEQNVMVQSPDEKINSDLLDLFFTRASGAAGNEGGQTPSASGGGLAAKQISRAEATGGVTVQQGERRATADRGLYTASDGKFVMSGGTPTIFDASEGTTTGRQLTFFLADATIIVDSENGSRTLTKHRVEK
jgi:LPS export ABC transporter protein LptC